MIARVQAPGVRSRPLDGAEADAGLERRFAEFVAEHRERAVGLAWRLAGGDWAAAEDVAQEAFARAFRGLGRFREEARLSTWFYRILLNEARRYARRQQLRTRLFGAGSERDSAPDPGYSPPESDPALARRIGEALARLPSGQREVFVLVHLEGFTVAEAAEATGRAPGTVKSHLHRALKALRADLADVRELAEDRR